MIGNLADNGANMKLHPSVTVDRVADAVERRLTSLDSNPGFCTACGDDAQGSKADARRYKCESCGERAVFGADELFLTMVP
jgi:hypothetical protein